MTISWIALCKIKVSLNGKFIRMNSKLTLSINEQIIEQAQKYAKSQGRSLSDIVEEYLKSISQSKQVKSELKFHPLVEELCGSVKIPKGQAHDEILDEYRIEKYLRSESNSLNETEYLLSTKANKKRLFESIKQVEKGDIHP